MCSLMYKFRSVDTMLEVQRFWAEDRNVDSLSTLTAQTPHGALNAQSSSEFHTESALQASQKGLAEETTKDKKFILMPYLTTNEPCFRCGATFQTGK